jgi:hypothetical protein
MQILKLGLAISLIFIFASCNLSNDSIADVKLIPVQIGDNYEYIDKEGKIIINPQFSEATVFREGLALVLTSGDTPKWGFIDESGKYSINAIYKNATVFSEGIAWVVPENGVPTAINKKGETKFTLNNAKYVRVFKDGLAAFCVEDSSSEKWGFVDKEGKIKINPQFLAVTDFQEGKSGFKNKEGKRGFIDNDGKIIINAQFELVHNFKNGFASVKAGKKAGIIDIDGKYCINPQFDAIYSDAENLFLIKQDKKWGWCDKDGKIIINPQFDVAFNFNSNELTPVKTDKTFGYIDKEGKLLINPQFDGALPFNNGIAAILSNDKVGFIDEKGKIYINPQFDNLAEDFIQFLTDGTSKYTMVQTDYFDINSIVNRIEKTFKEDSFENGITLNSPLKEVISKFNKTESDFNKFQNEHMLIKDEIVIPDVNLSFLFVGKPFKLISYDWYSESYILDQDFIPYAYAYYIKLSGKQEKKAINIFKALSENFAGLKKDTENCDEKNISFIGDKISVRILMESESEILIVVRNSTESYKIQSSSATSVDDQQENIETE